MKLGLGTVQFGLDYGVANSDGMTSRSEVERILRIADDNGIRILDTAAMYGESESVLGITLPQQHEFKIVTKTPSFRTNRITSHQAKQLRTAFNESLERLRQDRLYGLLLHHADDLLSPGGDLLFEEMRRLSTAGLVEKIGVSVYTAGQIDSVLTNIVPDLVQLPVNILDQRLIQGGYLAKLKDLGVEIHARSVFLQGLLLMDTAALPGSLAILQSHIKQLETFLDEHSLTRLQGALMFMAQQPELDTVLVGVCSGDQLMDILRAAQALPDDTIDMTRFALSDERYLNPSQWTV